MTNLALIPHSPAWHDDRRESIGASDAPVISGAAPASWGDPIELLQKLYAEKRGLLSTEAIDATDTPEQSTRKQFGLLMEDAIATWYTEHTGFRLQRVNTRPRHPELDWMRCSLDRVTVGVKPKRIVQLKQRRTDRAWGMEGTSEVPEDVLVQEHHEMAVLGLEVADVAVLIAGSEPRIYTIERDDDLIRDLIELESEFIACVREARTPDYSGLIRSGREIVPLREGELEANEALSELIQRGREARAAMKEAKAASEAIDEQVKAAMEGWTAVRGLATFKPNRDSTKVGWELIARTYRQLIEESGLDMTPQQFALALPGGLGTVESMFTATTPGARPLRYLDLKGTE